MAALPRPARMLTGMDEPERPNALVPVEPDQVDAYERKYMSGQGAVLYRGKRPAPAWMQLLLGSAALGGLAALFAGQWAAAALLIPMGFVLWALFSVLRFTVSEGAVSIQYGLFGPTIPIRAIERAEALDYSAMRFGGWGIRGMGREVMYNMPGDHGRALKITWRDAGGEPRTTWVGTPDPESAIAAISKALRALPPAERPAALSSGSDDDPG
jgi:hypothetical protein